MSVDEVPEMTFSSSPLRYPASSSPAPAPAAKQKRRLFQTIESNFSLKKPKLSHIDEDLSPNSGSTGVRPISIQPLVEFSEPDTEQAAQLSLIDITKPSLETPTAPQPLQLGKGLRKRYVELKTCSGKTVKLQPRQRQAVQSYESMIAERSVTAAGRAKRAYYGVDIHQLIDEAKINQELVQAEKDRQLELQSDLPQPSIEKPTISTAASKHQYQMWTEKYRARKFTELVGDERTHRSVLKWLKAWDKIVFPGSVKAKSKRVREDPHMNQDEQHRKIMLLTGPPGLGKTTLAHVCAKQAGYEVLEINASDDRSKDVVKGRIRDALGTETVRGIQEPGKSRRNGRPVCVVVDEVDGVVTGSGGTGGEGGFMKALIDLVQLDQKNSLSAAEHSQAVKGKRKGDNFKFLRPLILICNDVYAPSLRLLRQSSLAEIIHVRKPTIDKVVTRMKSVFERENITCDNDAVRRLCEDAWGLGSRKNSSLGARGSGDGDIRGVLVQGEWIAQKLKLQSLTEVRLTRRWIDGQLANASKSRAGPRGGTREVLDRIFLEGAGLPNLPTTLTPEDDRLFKASNNPIGVSDLRKRSAIHALREMIDTTGDHDRLVADCFSSYGTRVYQDDTFLSKPNASYDWLYFHDSVSSRIYSGQEWELNPYLSTSACAFHHLFASVENGASVWAQDSAKTQEADPHPFSGLKAEYAANEAEKAYRTTLTELQGNFSAELLRLFSSADTIATELIPNVSRVLCPDVKPVVVGGSSGSAAVASVRKESERNCVRNSVRVMNALGVSFEKFRIETEGYGNGGFALRMEPPLDTMSAFHDTKQAKSAQATRYAVRQVLDQELRKERVLQASVSRQARGSGVLVNPILTEEDNKENTDPAKPQSKVRRDFFGRVIPDTVAPTFDLASTKIDASTIAKSTATKGKAKTSATGQDRVWMSFNEGFSNAVRKPISLRDLMEGF